VAVIRLSENSATKINQTGGGMKKQTVGIVITYYYLFVSLVVVVRWTFLFGTAGGCHHGLACQQLHTSHLWLLLHLRNHQLLWLPCCC